MNHTNDTGNLRDANNSLHEEIEIRGWCKISFRDNKQNEERVSDILKTGHI